MKPVYPEIQQEIINDEFYHKLYSELFTIMEFIEYKVEFGI